MSNIYIKTIKDKTFTNITNNLFNNNINESQNQIRELVNLFNEHPILFTENTIFDNILNTTIKNDSILIKLIENSVKTIKNHDASEFEKSRSSLNMIYGNIVENNVINNKIGKLIENEIYYNITESEKYKIYDDVIEYLKNKKQSINEEVDTNIDDEIIDIAIKLHENTISELNDDNYKLYNEIPNISDNAFSLIKENVINKLNKMQKDDVVVSEKIELTKKTINEMKYSEDNFINDVLKLYKLQQNL